MADLAWHRPQSSADSRSAHSRPMTPQSQIPESQLEPCASTASLFLFAQGSVILCLHHDTLAIERRFELHKEKIYFICVDNVSERGAGRLVLSYDIGQTAIVWDLFTGAEIARFASFEHLRVAAWMRNGNVAFGNGKGDVILFEPSTSEHISARTIFDPITALAPASDCRTYAIGYQNGSILIATLHPTFTILHTLTTARGPSPIVALAWHASSSKQKSDMLATQTADGDLRVWSVAKPPGTESPRVIRALKRSEPYSPGPKWIAWSKNGRIVQYSDRETWAWDVRTKHVTYERIPTIEDVRGIANYGPTATLFTLGPNHTVQQYDVENPAMVANVQHLPIDAVLMPPGDWRSRPMSPPTLQAPAEIREPGSMASIMQTTMEMNAIETARQQRAEANSPLSVRSRTNSVSSRASSGRYRGPTFSPQSRSVHSGTTFSITSPGRETPQPSGTSFAYASSVSMSSAKGSRAGSRLRNEVVPSPVDQPLDELFPFTRARLSDVSYKQHRPLDESNLTPDDLRRQMLSMVFGWDGDIEELIRDELSRHPPGSQNAIILARWLGETDPDQMVSMIGSGSVSASDWMLLALSQMSGQAQASKIGQVFVQRLLETGDIHASAAVLLSLGDRNDAIEVYVSRNRFMEAVLLTCLLMPSDWQRQSYLVRRWGEHVVSHSEQQLAIRCFMCTGVEPSVPWASPTSQQATSLPELHPQPAPVTSPEPQPSISNTIYPPGARHRPGVGERLTAKNSALKLITSFGPQADASFKFPGLKSDDRTPTNAPGVTPIAESAVGESALSPGGLGSYRLNNIRSLNNAMSARTATPGGYSRGRLPSIGETPVDVHPPAFPAPKSLPTPVDSGSDKEKGDNSASEESHPNNEQQQNNHEEEPLLLLTSARYDPNKESHGPSPQTAVQATPDKLELIKDPPSPPVAVFESLKRHSRSRNGSRDRKPDGLQIQLPPAESSQSTAYGFSETLESRTFTPAQEQTDATADTKSPASTLHSFKSTKSPSISGRSIDQYISSLDEANFYAKQYRNHRLQSRERRHTDADAPDRSSRKHGSRNPSQDTTRGRSDNRYIQPAKRSPSSPVPMSPGDFAQYNASTESFEDIYRAKAEAGKPRSRSKSSRARTPSLAERRRHRSSSRGKDRKMKSSSRNTSRRRERNELTIRGRGSDREGSAIRSPSSPLPMSPVGLNPNIEDNLRLVTVDRERVRAQQRSSSRRPERGTSARREPSPDRRRPRPRSHSHQSREQDTSKEGEQLPAVAYGSTAENTGNGRPNEPTDVFTEESGNQAATFNAPSMSTAERLRKEMAAAELEARRLSLARHPSAPHIPLPGEGHHVKSASVGGPYADSSPFPSGSFIQRAHAGNKVSPSKSSPDYPNSSDSNSSRGRSSVQVGLPATPRAMRHPKYNNEYGEESVPEVPQMPEKLATLTENYPHGESGTKISRSISVPMEHLQPAVPSDLPHHPRFKPHIPRSRSSSRTRGLGHRRESSRELSPLSHGSSAPVTVSIEETMAQPTYGEKNPPILPELQHLNTPPPPPPAPNSSAEGHSPQNDVGTIDIAIEHEQVGRLLPRAMTAAPTTMAEPRSSGENNSPYRRMSLDHRRGRSINESFTSKIRNFTERMRSTSRTRRSPPAEASDRISPYESVPMVASIDNRI